MKRGGLLSGSPEACGGRRQSSRAGRTPHCPPGGANAEAGRADQVGARSGEAEPAPRRRRGAGELRASDALFLGRMFRSGPESPRSGRGVGGGERQPGKPEAPGVLSWRI